MEMEEWLTLVEELLLVEKKSRIYITKKKNVKNDIM